MKPFSLLIARHIRRTEDCCSFHTNFNKISPQLYQMKSQKGNIFPCLLPITNNAKAERTKQDHKAEQTKDERQLN